MLPLHYSLAWPSATSALSKTPAGLGELPCLQCLPEPHLHRTNLPSLSWSENGLDLIRNLHPGSSLLVLLSLCHLLNISLCHLLNTGDTSLHRLLNVGEPWLGLPGGRVQGTHPALQECLVVFHT